MDDDQHRPGLEQLGAQFAELSRLLSRRPGPPDPARVVELAARVVPHSAACGLTLTRGSRQPETLASSGQLAEQVDAIQFATGEGPCLEAIAGHDLVRADDLATDRQWPRFAARCVAETAVRSIFSVRLFVSGDVRAALNFYATGPGAFDANDVGTGAILAPFAELSVQNTVREWEVEQLQTALLSSRQIGTAVGILMARRLLTADQAFAQLVTASQHLNRKLRDIATEVARTGTLPEQPVRSSARSRTRPRRAADRG